MNEENKLKELIKIIDTTIKSMNELKKETEYKIEVLTKCPKCGLEH